MWRFITGFSLGVYVGSYYDCKPYADKVIEYIKENLPEKK
jgi:hypothetical protein